MSDDLEEFTSLVTADTPYDSRPIRTNETTDEKMGCCTNGFSVAHLKELIVSVGCFGKTSEESIERLRIMMQTTADDFENSGKVKVGF